MRATSKVSTGKLRFNRAAALASLAVAVMTVGSSHAYAAIRCSGAPFGIPADFNGLYVNFVTGTTSRSSTYAVGWDFAAYTPDGNLRFYSNSNSGNMTRYVGFADLVDVLPAGAIVGASSTFASTGANEAGAFQTGVSNGYVGVAFKNEGTDIVNYGWVSMTTTGPNGFPATVNQYCYQNDGTSIVVGGDKIFENGFEA